MSRICSRDMVPTMSGCLSWTCASTFVTSSSSLSPRTVSPHGQLTSLAISGSFPVGKASLGRIGADEHGVEDLHDLVRRQARPVGVLADLLCAGALVDADGAERPTILLYHVTADPADVFAHLLVADPAGSFCGLLQIRRGLPGCASSNHIGVHKGQDARCARGLPYAAGISTPSAASACFAASCSAAFFDSPEPSPSWSPSITAAQRKRRLCG